jgi:hypothetical protein
MLRSLEPALDGGADGVDRLDGAGSGLVLAALLLVLLVFLRHGRAILA